VKREQSFQEVVILNEVRIPVFARSAIEAIGEIQGFFALLRMVSLDGTALKAEQF
jgi:hypothetical protein